MRVPCIVRNVNVWTEAPSVLRSFRWFLSRPCMPGRINGEHVSCKCILPAKIASCIQLEYMLSLSQNIFFPFFVVVNTFALGNTKRKCDRERCDRYSRRIRHRFLQQQQKSNTLPASPFISVIHFFFIVEFFFFHSTFNFTDTPEAEQRQERTYVREKKKLWIVEEEFFPKKITRANRPVRKKRMPRGP